MEKLKEIISTMQKGKENGKQYKMKLTAKNGKEFGLGTAIYFTEDLSSHIALEVWPLKPGGYLLEHVEFYNDTCDYPKMIYALYNNGNIEAMIEACED